MTTGTQPNAGGAGDQGAPQWHDPAHGALVQTKGWKGYPDAVRDYAQLETFVGAPADRLIKLPAADKIDDAFRTNVFKQIGYTPPGAPAKWEDYGLAVPEGMDATYMQGIAAEAHKLGITKEQMQGLAAFNLKFAGEQATRDEAAAATAATERTTADNKTWGDRNTASAAKLKERFGPKYEEASEYMTREALRLGFKDPAEFEAFERGLALSGEGNLERFRSLLADVAEMRKESPFHRGGNQAGLSAEQAQAQLKQKQADPAWVQKALTRGTPEAEENLRLNLLSNGATIDEAELKRMAAGLPAQAAA